MPSKIPGTDVFKGKKKKKAKKTLHALTEQTSHLSVTTAPSTSQDDSTEHSSAPPSPQRDHTPSPPPIPRVPHSEDPSMEDLSGVPDSWEDTYEPENPQSSQPEALNESTHEETTGRTTEDPTENQTPREDLSSIREEPMEEHTSEQDSRTNKTPDANPDPNTNRKTDLDGHVRTTRTLENPSSHQLESQSKDHPSDCEMEDPEADDPRKETPSTSASDPSQKPGFWDKVDRNLTQLTDIEHHIANPDPETTPLFSDIVRDVAPHRPICPANFSSQDEETEYRRKYLDWHRDANQRLFQQLHLLQRDRHRVVEGLKVEQEKSEQLSAEIHKTRRENQEHPRSHGSVDPRNRRNKRPSPTPHEETEEDCQPKRAQHSVGSSQYYEEINQRLGRAEHKNWLSRRYEMAAKLPPAYERPEFQQDGLVPNMYTSHHFDTPLRKLFAPSYRGPDRAGEDPEAVNRSMQTTAEVSMAFWREVHAQRTDPTLGAMAHRCTPGQNITINHLDFLPCYINERSYRYRGVFFNTFQEAWIMDLAIFLGYDRESTDSLRNHLRRLINTDLSPAEKHIALQKTLAEVREHPYDTKDGERLGTTYARERLEEAYYASSHWYDVLADIITHQYAREPHLRPGRNALIQEALRAQKASKADGKIRYPLFAFQLVGPEKTMFQGYLRHIPIHLGGPYRDFYGLILSGVAIRLLKMRDENRLPFIMTLPYALQRQTTTTTPVPRNQPATRPMEAPKHDLSSKPQESSLGGWHKPRKTTPQTFASALERTLPATKNQYSPIAEKNPEKERRD